jgi:hypothetical protein
MRNFGFRISDFGLKAAVILLCVLCVSVVTGCSDTQIEGLRQAITNSEQQIQRVDQVVAKLEADKAAMDAQIAAMPEGKEKQQAQEVSAAYAKGIEAAKAAKISIQAALADYKARLATAEDEVDVITGAIQTSIPYLPPQAQPYGALALLGVGLIGALVKAFRNGSRARTNAAEAAAQQERADAAESAIYAVNAAKNAQGVVDFSNPATRAILDAAMGPAGKAAVDRVQGR